MIALSACSAPAEPQASHAWVRLPAIEGRPAAAYATLTGGTADGAITGITTPAAGRAELHRSMTGMGGMESMRPITSLPLPAGGKVALAPGGTHAMLFDLAGGLRPGGRTVLTFRMADGGEIKTTAALIAAGDPPPR